VLRFQKTFPEQKIRFPGFEIRSILEIKGFCNSEYFSNTTTQYFLLKIPNLIPRINPSRCKRFKITKQNFGVGQNNLISKRFAF